MWHSYVIKFSTKLKRIQDITPPHRKEFTSEGRTNIRSQPRNGSVICKFRHDIEGILQNVSVEIKKSKG